MFAPILSLRNFKLFDHVRVEDSPIYAINFASAFAFLASLLSPLLSSSCCVGGGGGIFVFLGIVGCEDKGEVDCQAAFEDLFDDLIHVNDAVVDCGAVFLLLAEVEPMLDADFKSIEDIGGISEIPGDSYLYCRGLLFDETYCPSHFDGECAL